jgi:hypothetical protein
MVGKPPTYTPEKLRLARAWGALRRSIPTRAEMARHLGVSPGRLTVWANSRMKGERRA